MRVYSVQAVYNPMQAAKILSDMVANKTAAAALHIKHTLLHSAIVYTIYSVGCLHLVQTVCTEYTLLTAIN